VLLAGRSERLNKVIEGLVQCTFAASPRTYGDNALSRRWQGTLLCSAGWRVGVGAGLGLRSTFTAGPPVHIFSAKLASGAGAEKHGYIVSGDNRFLVNQPRKSVYCYANHTNPELESRALK
jgi:hypothetical protein